MFLFYSATVKSLTFKSFYNSPDLNKEGFFNFSTLKKQKLQMIGEIIEFREKNFPLYQKNKVGDSALAYWIKRIRIVF